MKGGVGFTSKDYTKYASAESEEIEKTVDNCAKIPNKCYCCSFEWSKKPTLRYPFPGPPIAENQYDVDTKGKCPK
jgi:hypothetical protein